MLIYGLCVSNCQQKIMRMHCGMLFHEKEGENEKHVRVHSPQKTARMRSEGHGTVCHLWSVRKRCHVLNGQQRSKKVVGIFLNVLARESCSVTDSLPSPTHQLSSVAHAYVCTYAPAPCI